MKAPTTLDLYRETWKARKAGPEEIKTLQMARLNEIVAYARQHSRVYAESYQGLPQTITSLEQLPVVSKADLMPRFEDWVTDPAVSRTELDEFIQDHSKTSLFTPRCQVSHTPSVPLLALTGSVRAMSLQRPL